MFNEVIDNRTTPFHISTYSILLDKVTFPKTNILWRVQQVKKKVWETLNYVNLLHEKNVYV